MNVFYTLKRMIIYISIRKCNAEDAILCSGDSEWIFDLKKTFNKSDAEEGRWV